VAEPNLLYYGDNLDVLRRHVKDESVDLVYLDPPFNSNATYNLLFEEHGEKAAAQVQAFTDSWEWNTDARQAYEEIVEAGGKVADTMRAFRTMLGASDMLAYLSMMAPRLIELRRVLKPTGSLWLHCDPTASHYLKILLDAVFGARNFRNEIIWDYSFRTMITPVRLSRKHDVLLFFAKSDAHRINTPVLPWTRDEIIRVRKQEIHTDAEGREWVWMPGGIGHSKNKPKFLDDIMAEGKPVSDVWHIGTITSSSKERLGYPTQKPLTLLERVLAMSSNPGDLVLDPFCGCGTTVDAAQDLGRQWIGIDITHLAIGLIKHRLVDRYGPAIASTYRTVGEPTTVDDARVLAQEDPFQFQAWALGLVGARVAGSDRKGGDKGIDGRLYFHEGGSETRQIVFSVKAGHLVPTFVRDLRGVIEREKAEIGVLLSFEEPTAGMRSEAAEAGFYKSPWGQHSRIQLRTVGDLLAGKGIDYPHVTGANVTHRRANRVLGAPAESLELFAAEEPKPYGPDSD
jgi:DNA modification methylase